MAGHGTRTTNNEPSQQRRHRDDVRLRLAVDLMNGATLSTELLAERYYASMSPSSFHKTFKRDREALEEQGIHLAMRADGRKKLWTLDRERTVARPSEVGEDAGRALQLLLQPLVGQTAAADARELAFALARIGRKPPVLQQGEPNPSGKIYRTLLEAFEERRPCAIAYRSLLDDASIERVIRPYGFFELGSSTYVVALRSRQGASNEIRTLNLGRVRRARLLADNPPYEIPQGFDVADYRLLPFEIGEHPQTVRFVIPLPQAPSFREAVRRRGTVEERENGSLIWTGKSCDHATAARWAIERGAIPVAPSSLVEVWKRILEEALPYGERR